jgi:Rhs element Vgr protein
VAGKAIPEITIDGNAFGPISQLTLDQPWNGHHSFVLVCPFRERLNSLLDLGKDYVGKDITIQLKEGIREGSGELSFKGVITNVKLSKHESATMQLILQGFSPTRLMDDGPHNQTFTEKTLGDIVKAVTGNYPDLEVKAEVKHADVLPYVTQYKETAFAFLRRMMATYGEWCYYDGEQTVFGQPPSGEETELTFGRDMMGLDISADIVPASFKLLGYDYIGDKHYDSSSSNAKVQELDDLSKLMESTSEEVFSFEPTFAEPFPHLEKTQLDQQALRRRAGRSAQNINLFGQSSRLDLKLGQVIVVKALGHTMGINQSSAADYGSFRLLHLTHHFDGQGNYDNSFQGIPSRLEVPPVTDSLIRPPFAEAQPAEVTDNHDPEQLGRVKVQFPWQKDSGEMTPFIRVAAAGAGGGHGAYFVPEKGDQVLVGFSYNNPDRPMVYGSLYHGKVKPPNAADPDNNSKIIRTRSGQEIKLSDASGEESIIITNGTNTITLSLSGDTTIDISTIGDFTLNAKNITFNAEENYTLNAGKAGGMNLGTDAKINAGSGLVISGGPKVEINADNINANAGIALSVQGGATAEIKSPSTTVSGDTMVTISGPMVKLN